MLGGIPRYSEGNFIAVPAVATIHNGKRLQKICAFFRNLSISGLSSRPTSATLEVELSSRPTSATLASTEDEKTQESSFLTIRGLILTVAGAGAPDMEDRNDGTCVKAVLRLTKALPKMVMIAALNDDRILSLFHESLRYG